MQSACQHCDVSSPKPQTPPATSQDDNLLARHPIPKEDLDRHVAAAAGAAQQPEGGEAEAPLVVDLQAEAFTVATQ